jgi:hypothetical protein
MAKKEVKLRQERILPNSAPVSAVFSMRLSAFYRETLPK